MVLFKRELVLTSLTTWFRLITPWNKFKFVGLQSTTHSVYSHTHQHSLEPSPTYCACFLFIYFFECGKKVEKLEKAMQAPRTWMWSIHASLQLILKTTQISVMFTSVLGGPVLGWTYSLVSDGHNWSHPANPTQICLQPQMGSSQQTHCGKHDAALMQHKSSGNAFVQGFTSLSLPLGLKRASQPSLVVSLPPPPGHRHKGTCWVLTVLV